MSAPWSAPCPHCGDDRSHARKAVYVACLETQLKNIRQQLNNEREDTEEDAMSKPAITS